MSAMTTIKTSLRLFIAAIFLPLAFSGMMYIGSTTAYTWGVFDKVGFHQQYSDGIYKYRVLGRESLLYFFQKFRKFGNVECIHFFNAELTQKINRK